MDRILRGMTKDKNIRFFAVDSTQTVKKAVEIHHLSITNSVIIGRMLSAALMMSIDLKSDENVLTLKIDCDGPIGGVIVTGNKNGFVKGYVKNPEVEFPLNEETDSIDISKAIGKGTLNIIKDLGLKRPYAGQVEMKYGTIAKDLTYYFVKSEQIPSSVGLGTLVMPDGSVSKAGGFIIQMMPDAPKEIISQIEENLMHFPNLTDMMDMGHSIETLLEKFILKDLSPEINEIKPGSYKCDCSKEKFENGLKLLSKQELQEANENNETLTVKCHFCNTDYKFGKNEIEEIIDSK